MKLKNISMSYFVVLFKNVLLPMWNNFAIFPHFRPTQKILLTLPLFFLLTGCAKYKFDNQRFQNSILQEQLTPEEKIRQRNEQNASKHWLYQAIPRHRAQIRWFDAVHWTNWMIFGNDDEGIFGESPRSPYKPLTKNTFGKALRWWLRNPLHNFTHYTIGSADRNNSEITLLNLTAHRVQALAYAPTATHNFGAKCSSFFLGFHGGKPFLSLRLIYPWKSKTEIYLGWRKEGNFGIKIQPMAKLKKQSTPFLKIKKKESRAANLKAQEEIKRV